MHTITASHLRRMIDGDEKFELINVLPEDEFLKAHIPGSINIPVDDRAFATKVRDRVEGDVDREIVVYCANLRCDASAKAAQTLKLAGFTNITRFEGGTQGWKDAGYPIETGTVRA